MQVPVEKNSVQWAHAYWDSPKAYHYDIDIISQWSLWISGNDDDIEDNINDGDDHNDQDKNIKEL